VIGSLATSVIGDARSRATFGRIFHDREDLTV
jgi:hypothetical protein